MSLASKMGLFSSLVTVLMLTACQASSRGTSATETTSDKSIAQTEDANKTLILTHHLWRLTEIVGQNIHISGTSNLVFSPENQRVSGSAGCNRYFGSYAMKQESLSFSQLGMTKMQCMNMTEENAFIRKIHLVNRFTLEQETLILFKDQTPLMKFTAEPLPKPSPSPSQKNG